MYYHYTSLDTFLAILQGIDYKNEEPVLHLRASRIDKVNDPTEMTIDKRTFLSIVQHYEDKDKNKIDPCLRISRRIECMDDEKFNELIKNERSDHLPYIISLSKYEDFLPMWSLYGDKGRGVCLGFSMLDICKKSVLFQKLINPYAPVLIDDVCYRDYEKSKTVLRAIDLNYPKTAKDDIEDSIANMYLAASPFIKHPSYEYENEFRISIFNFVKDEWGTMYDSKTYIDYYIPINSLKTVTLGAKLCSSVISELLGDYFSKHGLQIEIQKSRIPFR